MQWIKVFTDMFANPKIQLILKNKKRIALVSISNKNALISLE